jgi:hypothetical protein
MHGQGCQIFLVQYTNTERKYTKWPHNYQRNIPNGLRIFQRAINKKVFPLHWAGFISFFTFQLQLQIAILLTSDEGDSLLLRLAIKFTNILHSRYFQFGIWEIKMYHLANLNSNDKFASWVKHFFSFLTYTRPNWKVFFGSDIWVFFFVLCSNFVDPS